MDKYWKILTIAQVSSLQYSRSAFFNSLNVSKIVRHECLLGIIIKGGFVSFFYVDVKLKLEKRGINEF